MEADKLPQGWTIATLPELVGEKGVFKDGDWVESKDQDPEGNVRLIQLADIGDGAYLNKSNRYLTEEKSVELNCTYLKQGDLLVSRMADPIARACIFPGDQMTCVTVVDVCIVRPSCADVNTRWLKHAINSPQFRVRARKEASGSTRTRISRSNLAELKIPVPPPAEQDRIADRLDAIQSRTQATGETLSQVPDRIEEYRQSVLNAAFTGQLTAGWREDHPGVEPGKLLLERILDERHREWKKDYRAKYEAKGKKPPSGWKSRYSEPVEPTNYPDHSIPDSWEWSGMNTVFQWSNGDSLTKDEQEDGPYHVYGGNGVKGSHTDYMVEEETVVIGRVGANCGNVHLAEPESWITDNAIYADWQSSLIDEEFLVRQLRHLRLNRIAGGSGQPYISQKKLNSLVIALPPYDEQVEISRRIRQRLNKIDEMADHVDQAHKRLSHLDRSVLAKAFRGELVETEAERARREDRDYETAEELLERVQSESSSTDQTTSSEEQSSTTTQVGENGQFEMRVVEDENSGL